MFSSYGNSGGIYSQLLLSNYAAFGQWSGWRYNNALRSRLRNLHNFNLTFGFIKTVIVHQFMLKALLRNKLHTFGKRWTVNLAATAQPSSGITNRFASMHAQKQFFPIAFAMLSRIRLITRTISFLYRSRYFTLRMKRIGNWNITRNFAYRNCIWSA